MYVIVGLTDEKGGENVVVACLHYCTGTEVRSNFASTETKEGG